MAFFSKVSRCDLIRAIMVDLVDTEQALSVRVVSLVWGPVINVLQDPEIASISPEALFNLPPAEISEQQLSARITEQNTETVTINYDRLPTDATQQIAEAIRMFDSLANKTSYEYYKLMEDIPDRIVFSLQTLPLWYLENAEGSISGDTQAKAQIEREECLKNLVTIKDWTITHLSPYIGASNTPKTRLHKLIALKYLFESYPLIEETNIDAYEVIDQIAKNWCTYFNSLSDNSLSPE